MQKNVQLLQRLKIWQKLVLIAVFMGAADSGHHLALRG